MYAGCQVANAEKSGKSGTTFFEKSGKKVEKKWENGKRSGKKRSLKKWKKVLKLDRLHFVVLFIECYAFSTKI